MIPRLATDPVAIGSDHAGAEFVEDLERRLVAVQAKLTLELDGRDAWRMARNQVGGPEPDRQRRAGPLHDRAGRQRIIPLTFAALQDLRPVGWGRAPSVSVAFPRNVGVQSPHRTTRVLRLIEVGERYVSACQQVQMAG